MVVFLVYIHYLSVFINFSRWLENNELQELPAGIFDNNPELETMLVNNYDVQIYLIYKHYEPFPQSIIMLKH